VIAKYNETNDEYIKVIKSMDLFYRPLADENQIIYKVKEIDGRDLKLETGDYRIDDQNDIVIDNGVVKNFTMLKSATVFRDTSDSNLRVGEYINVKLDDNGDVELAYELEGLEIRKILLK
jgi:predicted 3-demethylubiquinone-9 3-methyltransferase (glyoxalase superfamily)